MGALDKDNPGVAAVTRVRDLLRQLLDEAPQTNAIEPALNQADFENLSGRVTAALSSAEPFQDEAETRDAAKTHQFAVIETAARDLFDRLIASTPIDSPEFCKMWHLLDILSILSDNGLCDPALLFWLVEVLLDSQTIAGCRKIFDYLESRRERITAKHFKQKNLVILRSCNELLRRLSRAEDTAFCGRVFIFMFQSFPLGDRSSVNLRGEFHVENVTNYQESPSAGDESKMDLDKDSTDEKAGSKAATSAAKKTQKAFDPDALYAPFWSLQDSFSQPLKLFEAPHFARFKSNLEATMKAFQAIQNAEGPQSFKSADGSKRDVRRRKEDEAEDEGPETFNPKYLTSKDLFELEIGDLSLRRHVLVQALIIIDFVLSLSPGMKEKLSGGNASNKAVLYNDQFEEDNVSQMHDRLEGILNKTQIKWANDMKTTISDYLKRGHDGPYFYRMVETVLARDKNWISWKMASCPTIQREPVSWHTFSDTKTSAQRLATTKRLRPTPLNAVNMDFLRDDNPSRDLSLRRDPSRYQLPDLDSFKQGIADDDFDLATAKDDEARQKAAARKSSKTWRALRLARFKMAAFDKIDDDDDISPIFQPLLPSDDDDEEASNHDDAHDAPDDRGPVIVAADPVSDAAQVVDLMLERQGDVFASVVRHAAREPLEGEVRGRDFHFVAKLEFNQLRDGDRLVEYGESEGVDYGTSLAAIDAIVDTGKAAKFARSMDFAARYVNVCLSDRGPDIDSVADFDKIVVALDSQEAAGELISYIYENSVCRNDEDGGSDAALADAPSQEIEGDAAEGA
ncbi:hypothetical protein CDD80_6715 [Ophiocordyceps camponoti-rufipedis]|uniref:Guanylate kinase-like domain-containing protein n=1 Tax=Ophiocordyceps camponoti-rufipedis TaxID=2004952 RepID=A0A2C5ZES8_9HYPO|nr:hypothetical protein CDD80_6715 [Ophiocordyceps camponoti-rufipedis]